MSFYAPPPFPNMAPLVGFAPAMPAPLPMNQSVIARLPIKPEPDVATDYQNNDPVTKAVMDNIMGKLPTKKQVVISTCEICKLEFSGQVVLEMHLAGAKHAKKVKSQEIMAQLQTAGETFTTDEKSKILKCEICNVVVNSSQQLQTHLSGNKHKQKALKAVKAQPANGTRTHAPQVGPPTNGAAPTPAGKTTAPDSSPSPNDASANAGLSTTMMPGIQQLENGSGNKMNKYFCDTCNIALNSDFQMEQHARSRKHSLMIARAKRPAPYWKKPRPSYQQNQPGRQATQGITAQCQNPLSNNFVSGGSITM